MQVKPYLQPVVVSIPLCHYDGELISSLISLLLALVLSVKIMILLFLHTSRHTLFTYFMCLYSDTESAKASRRQLKEAIYRALFDMNVPAVCAINQVSYLEFWISWFWICKLDLNH